MSYRLWIKSLPTTLRHMLRQPHYIAGIISVGVHGLMWFVLPILPLQSSEAEEPEIQRRVSLVELTPAEQGRLPDFSTSQVTIPQVPPQLPPQSDFYSLTPLPNPYSPIPTPSYPNYQGVPPIILPNQSSRYQDFNRRSSGSTSRRQTARNSGNSSANTDAPDENTSGQSDANNTDANSGNPPDSNNTNPNNSNSNTTDPNNTNSNNTDPNNSDSSTTNPDQTAQNNTNPPPPRDYVARLQQEQQQLRELYSYNAEGTGEGDRTSEFSKWLLEELRGTSENLDDITGLEIDVVYPRQACFFQLEPSPNDAAFGVVLDGEGDLVGDPRKLQSSGYGAFDQQALEAIKASDFSQAPSEGYVLNGNRVYYVRVKFVRPENGCPATAPPQQSEG